MEGLGLVRRRRWGSPQGLWMLDRHLRRSMLRDLVQRAMERQAGEANPTEVMQEDRTVLLLGLPRIAVMLLDQERWEV